MWARYSSAQFDQGAGRHACNNPYNDLVEEQLFQEMQKKGASSISHQDFLDIIAPSFTAVEAKEDMAAILARTHVIVLTENGVYYRVSNTQKVDVPFIQWPEPSIKDILAEEHKPIFKAYRQNPSGHSLPDNYHADVIWSQELLRKLLNGESVPRTITIRRASLFSAEVSEVQQAPRLLPASEMAIKVKKEREVNFFKNLKRSNFGIIELDSPSPPKRSRSTSAPSVPNPDDLPGMSLQNEFPEAEESDGLQVELERMMELEMTEMAAADAPDDAKD